MQQNLVARTLVTQLLTKFYGVSIGHRLAVSQWVYKLWGLEHGGFVNATAWDPSSPALRALNASEAVSHRNTTQASPIL
jgi:hypothetical protein